MPDPGPAGTRATFYVLADATLDARTLLACRLTHKAYQLGQRVRILVDSQEQAQLMDRRLWDWQAESFLPHGLTGSADDLPVEIALAPGQPTGVPVLINLAEPTAPPASATRIIEIVIQQEPYRSAARERLKRYRQQGIAVEVNDLRRR